MVSSPEAPATPPTLQDRALDELTRAGVQWAMLRPSRTPEAGDDVDVLVATSDYPLARSVLLHLGFLQLPGRGRGSHRFFLGHDPSLGDWLTLDLVTELAYGRWFEFKTSLSAECLARRSGPPTSKSLDPDDELFALLLHCLLDKGFVAPRRASQLEQLVLVERAAGPVRHLVSGLLPSGWTTEGIEQAVRARDWARVESLRSPLSRRWRRRDLIGITRRTVVGAVLRLTEPLLLHNRPGLTVALVGPDGAGKSTLAERIKSGMGLPVRCVYMGLWRRGSSRLPRFVAVIEIAFRPFRIWGRYLTAIGHRLVGRMVVFDRYPFDATLPPKGRLVWLKRAYFWFLARCAPAPDMLIILDAPGETLFARKGEEDPDSLERERRYFRALAGRVKNAVIVDASSGAADVFKHVDRLIWSHLTRRTRGSSTSGSRLVARLAKRGGAAAVSSVGLVGRRLVRSRRRTRANTALDLILADLRAQSLIPESWGAGRWSVTDTGVGTVLLGPRDGQAQLMVKLPLSAGAEGALQTHVQVVKQLSADPRLAGRFGFLPVIRGEGHAGGLGYVVEELLPGRPASSLLRSRYGAAALRAAALAIAGIHEQTGDTLRVDEAVLDAWVWRPVRAVCAALPTARRSGWRIDALEGIGENVASALNGHDVQVAWVHGDYWPGNVLVSEDGSTVTGIVDWSLAEPGLPPLHDSIDLILFARRIQQRRDVGFLARAMLEDARLDPAEDYVIRTAGLGWPADSSGIRLAIVLAWLRHIGSVAGVGGHVQNPWWVRQNLDPMLRAPLPSLHI